MPGRSHDEDVLVVSAFGDDSGGGLFAVDGARVEEIDRISSTGLAVADGRVARFLRSPVEVDSGSELLLYDERGVERYLRLDAVTDPHDVAWDGHHFVAVASFTNSIVWFGPSGNVARTWRAPGNGDAWHLNSLCADNGRIYVCAFGRFERHRDWSRRGSKGRGLVFELETGEEVLTGLDQPHTPRRLGDGWLVCNSASQELLLVGSRSPHPLARVELRGFTRGIAVDDDVVFVGESTRRDEAAPDGSASIAVVSSEDWSVVDRIALPADEIYDLVWVPSRLVDGLRRGFRTNAVRVAEQGQLELFDEVGVRPPRLWATGDPLPNEALRVRIEADVPATMTAGELVTATYTIENAGTAILTTAPPHPVHVSYRWFLPGSESPVDGVESLRAPLPRSLPPGVRDTGAITIEAPAEHGSYELRLTAVQELVAWFDDVDTASASRHAVIVEA